MSLEQSIHNELQSIDNTDLASLYKDVNIGIDDSTDLSLEQKNFRIDDFDHGSFHQQKLARKEELLSSTELRDKCKDAKNVSSFLVFEEDFFDSEDEEGDVSDYLLYPFFNLKTGVPITIG